MTTEATRVADGAKPSKALQVALWVVQTLLAVVFTCTGFWKLLTPVPKLAAMIPWAGQVPEAFMQATDVIDLCGGVGILRPARRVSMARAERT